MLRLFDMTDLISVPRVCLVVHDLEDSAAHKRVAVVQAGA